MMRPPRAGVRYALAWLAALGFSALYLHVCSQVGRLSRDLQYDDVGYAVEAANRFDLAMSGGLPELLRSFAASPPHSFLASLQALVAFAIFGLHDLSLYASNAWLLVAMALMLAFALRERPATVLAVALAFALTSPLAYFAIAEFRPDIALGFTTALMAWCLLDAGFRADARMVRWAGAMLALSLVAKSTFFAHTLGIAAGLAAAALLATWAQRWPWMPRFALSGRQVAAFLAIGLALAVPFYLVNGADTLDYFWSNTVGSRGQVWNFSDRLPLAQVLEGFLPLLVMLGRLTSVAAALAAAGFALALHRRGQKEAAARVIALLVVAAVSASIIVVGRQPSHFFFATMHWLLLFAAIFGYVRLHDTLGDAGRRRMTLAAGLCIAGLAAWNSSLQGMQWPPGAQHGDSWNERIVALITADVRGDGFGRPPPARVLALTATAVNPDTLAWVGRLAGQPLQTSAVQVLADEAQAKRMAADADYVVVPDRARMPHDGWLPVAKLQGPMLAWLRQDPRFQPLVAGDTAAPYQVFANREKTPRFHPQDLLRVDEGAIVSVENFRGEEGPYPGYEPPLPRLRWIEGLRAAVCVAIEPGRPMDFGLRYRARTPGTLKLSRDGQPFATADLVNGAFGELHARFTPTATRTCFEFSIVAPPNDPPLYVFITGFTLTAAK